jgi:hypothetical protein
MVSLTDLFNSTFFIFLGILMLAMAFLVIYFENKMRDQNHKISSMLSLVSTLADDLNGVKMGLNHLIIKGGNSFNESSNIYEENLGKITTQDLIEVSDDEDSNNDSDEDSNDGESSDIDLDINEISDTDNESKEEEEEEEEDDDDDDDSSIEKENIKVLKLNILKEKQDSENNELDLEETLDLDCDFEEPCDELPEMTEEYVGKVLDLKYENLTEPQALEESQNTQHILGSDLKTISINLGEDEEKGEVNIDYKKLPLQKLRSIVVEKGLASNTEVSKLKKPELLKIIDA